MTLSAVSGFTKLTRFWPRIRSLPSGCASVGILNSTANAQTIARSLFFLNRSRNSPPKTICRSAVNISWSKCQCGIHTKGDKEYVTSLEEERFNETQSQTAPIRKLEDFDCKREGPEVTLSKSTNNEIITIKANLSESFDYCTPKELEKKELKALPDLTVEVAKGGKILIFYCCFTGMKSEEKIAKSFGDYLSIFSVDYGVEEMSDPNFQLYYDDYRFKNGGIRAVAKKYLNDLGITNDFVDKLVSIFTSYERELNDNLLQQMGTFSE